jgi:hypothetical protein
MTRCTASHAPRRLGRVETGVAPSEDVGRARTSSLGQLSAALEAPHPALVLNELVYGSARRAALACGA